MQDVGAVLQDARQRHSARQSELSRPPLAAAGVHFPANLLRWLGLDPPQNHAVIRWFRVRQRIATPHRHPLTEIALSPVGLVRVRAVSRPPTTTRVCCSIVRENTLW